MTTTESVALVGAGAIAALALGLVGFVLWPGRRRRRRWGMRT